MTTRDEITALEARLRDAELGPDPAFFEEVLHDEALLDGQKLKARVVEAHRPGKGPKFVRVEMSETRIVDLGDAALVSCTGEYETPQRTFRLRFTRVWKKVDGRWQIVAGTTAPAEPASDVVRASFAAFTEHDRDAAERLLAEDFRFSSPRDDALDKRAYFERCFPNADALRDLRIERIVEEGSDVFVEYVATRVADDVAFRNVEHVRVIKRRIASVEVFFGRELPRTR